MSALEKRGIINDAEYEKRLLLYKNDAFGGTREKTLYAQAEATPSFYNWSDQ